MRERKEQQITIGSGDKNLNAQYFHHFKPCHSSASLSFSLCFDSHLIPLPYSFKTTGRLSLTAHSEGGVNSLLGLTP